MIEQRRALNRVGRLEENKRVRLACNAMTDDLQFFAPCEKSKPISNEALNGDSKYCTDNINKYSRTNGAAEKVQTSDL